VPMQRTLALAFGGMFAGFFLASVRPGFHGLNGFVLGGTGFAAIVFLSQAAWPHVSAAAARRLRSAGGTVARV
jgi:hypothetical protein